MKTSELVEKKWFIYSIVLLFLIWLLLVVIGRNLPYIVTEHSFELRFYFLFPVIVLLFMYFALIHRWKETGRTGYEMRMSEILDIKDRVKQSCVAFIGLLLIPFGISTTTADLIASVSYLVSNKPKVEIFKVLDSKGVRNLSEVKLLNLSNQEEAFITLSYDNFDQGTWNHGATVEIKGRTSIFGTIAEEAIRLE